jgi:putative membrane protein
MKKLKEYILCFIDGFFMSIADSVPGVSGGTVAFILGFYDKFIISLDNLIRGDKKAKIKAIKYLFKIGIG